MKKPFIRGKSENDYDHSRRAFSFLELIFGGLKLAQEITVEFGFTVFVVSDRRKARFF